MEQPNRQYAQNEAYRFGFNGKENDREWGTASLTQDYGFRLYNPAIAKFLSVDPLSKDYPELTPYQFASNTPIQAIDLDGLEAYFVHGTFMDERFFTQTKIQRVVGIFTGIDQSNIINFNWGEEASLNSKIERGIAARRLANKIIASYDPINNPYGVVIISHSHGGNVGIEAVNILVNEHLINPTSITLVAVNTPFREDYMLKNKEDNYLGYKATNVNLITVNAEQTDWVQTSGNYDLEDIIYPRPKMPAKSKHTQADYNITYKDAIPTSDGGCGYSNHCGFANVNIDRWLPKLSSIIEKIQGKRATDSWYKSKYGKTYEEYYDGKQNRQSSQFAPER